MCKFENDFDIKKYLTLMLSNIISFVLPKMSTVDTYDTGISMGGDDPRR